MNRCPMCDYYQAESNALKDHIMKMAEAVGKTFKHEFTAEVGDKILLEKYEAIQAENKRMREALERRNAAILWLCVNGPDNFGGADFYSFAQKAFPGLGEDEVGDAQGVEGYLRMIESDEDYPSCLDAAKRNMCEEAMK